MISVSKIKEKDSLACCSCDWRRTAIAITIDGDYTKQTVSLCNDCAHRLVEKLNDIVVDPFLSDL